MRNLRFAALAAIVCAFVAPSIYAWAAGNWSTLPQVGQPTFSGGTSTGATGTVSTSSVPAGPSFLTGLEVVPADTNLAGGASPQSVTIPVPMLGNFFGTPRNYLDNGALNITQAQGTSTVTCAVNAAIAIANWSADRWGCQANVTSGAGRSAIITASPSPPTGFTNSMKVTRASGVLTQPICVMQAIPTAESTTLQGQVVTFSFYAAALASLAADNGSTMQAVIFTGTGADEGFSGISPTASPAITPAWTGIATALNSTITITTTFTRYAVQATIPAAATEIGAALCFTPTANTSGVTAATDGFAWTGAQLERSPGASAFEFHTVQFDLEKAQRYLAIVTEPASGVAVPIFSTATAATTAAGSYAFPVTMSKAPTFGALGTALGATTWTNKCGAVNNVLASTFVVTATANTVTGASLTITSSGATAGFACVLTGAGGGSVLSWWTGL